MEKKRQGACLIKKEKIENWSRHEEEKWGETIRRNPKEKIGVFNETVCTLLTFYGKKVRHVNIRQGT